MPRLLALLAVGAACAAALDLENEARHELYDDALDEAEPLLAPDHAAGIRAELDLMKEVLEEQCEEKEEEKCKLVAEEQCMTVNDEARRKCIFSTISCVLSGV